MAAASASQDAGAPSSDEAYFVDINVVKERFKDSPAVLAAILKNGQSMWCPMRNVKMVRLPEQIPEETDINEETLRQAEGSQKRQKTEGPAWGTSTAVDEGTEKLTKLLYAVQLRIIDPYLQEFVPHYLDEKLDCLAADISFVLDEHDKKKDGMGRLLAASIMELRAETLFKMIDEHIDFALGGSSQRV